MRTLVAECKIPSAPSRYEEVETMAESISYELIAPIVQQRKNLHHTYCVGPGKLEEIKMLDAENDIEAVVFANTLPSAQVFKIQRVLGGTDIKVIDRNLLILEVFDKRAMTKEAKLQIALAKLKYTFSWGREFLRLEGILGGQVGWSGPGDYPYHDYERTAKKRIANMEKELRDLYSKKNLLRDHRRERGFPIVALAGYTQSGKTTFFNRLVSETKDTGLGPFTTLSTFARKVQYDGGKTGPFDFILVDSIGFIEDMHPVIMKAFNTTLGEITNSDLILLFVDISEDLETIFRKLTASYQTLRKIAADTPVIICANKIDLTNPIQLDEARKLVGRVFGGTPIVDASALKGENVDQVVGLAFQHLNGGTVPKVAPLELTDNS